MDVALEPLPPKVTALIVSYNSASSLRRLIETLEANRPPAPPPAKPPALTKSSPKGAPATPAAPEPPPRELLEILVVDLGSTDESPRLDAEFENVTILRLPKHFGATKAMNIATRTAAGEYIFYLDPHVELPPDAIARLSASLDADDELAAVAPLLTDAAGTPVPLAYELPTASAFAATIGMHEFARLPVDRHRPTVTVPYLARTAVMTRKLFVQGMNYFDERYGHFWPDAELAMQIRKAQKKAVIVTGVTAVLRNYSPEQGAGFTADRILGAAAYLSKHEGWGKGLGFYLSALLRSLFGFQLGLFWKLLTRQKIDGNQGSL
jgi:GT2 family glycosyltransferase